MISPNALQEQPSVIGEFLKNKGVKKIAIIDDGFDRVAGLGSEITSFWEAIKDNPAALKDLTELAGGLPCHAETDINETLLWKMIKNNEADKPWHIPFEEHIWSVIDIEVFQLAGFLKQLTRQTEVEQCYFKASDDIDKISQDHTYDIIFLDLILGFDPPQIQEDGTLVSPYIETATDYAHRIYKGASDEKKPLIVLMSSKPVGTRQREEFCSASKLLAGMFSFAPKTDLMDRDNFVMRMASLASGIESGHLIQRFFTALEANINNSINRFINDVKHLTLEDYAYIQRLSLRDDGHPLGDYMLWLYSGYLSSLVFEETLVKNAGIDVNQMTFAQLPPTHLLPSRFLMEMYTSCLFDYSVDSVLGSVSPESSIEGIPVDAPRLELGDILVDEQRKCVWVVINASCDLAYSLHEIRPFNGNQSIILVPGVLVSFNDPVSNNAKRHKKTEPFRLNGMDYRIEWNINNTTTVPYGQVGAWQLKNGAKRLARLRETYALDIQREFASSLTRVGHPVSPPVYRSALISLIANNGTASPIIGTRTDAAVIAPSESHIKEKESVILKVDFVVELVKLGKEWLRNQILELSHAFQNAAEGKSELPRAQIDILAQKIEANKKILADENKWLTLLNPIPYPAPQKERPILGDLIGLYHKIPSGTECHARCSLILEISEYND